MALDDVAVGLWAAARGEPEDCFERDVPIKAAIVAKYEFLEVGVDVFAAQTMIRPQRPALQQREGAVAPGQDDVGRSRQRADRAGNRPRAPDRRRGRR